MSNLYTSRYAHRFHLANIARSVAKAHTGPHILLTDRDTSDEEFRRIYVAHRWIDAVQALAMLANA